MTGIAVSHDAACRYAQRSADHARGLIETEIDEDRAARLEEAMAADRSLSEDTEVDIDPYKVKDRIEAALRAAAER